MTLLNAISEAVDFDFLSLELREITVGPLFHDIFRWSHRKLERYIRRLHKIRCEYVISGAVDDGYNLRRGFDITVQFHDGYFTCDFNDNADPRRYLPIPTTGA